MGMTVLENVHYRTGNDGGVLKRVANGERGMLWKRQSVRAWRTPGQYRHARNWQREGGIRATSKDALRAGYKTAV
jgi:hypothetical protein